MALLPDASNRRGHPPALPAPPRSSLTAGITRLGEAQTHNVWAGHLPLPTGELVPQASHPEAAFCTELGVTGCESPVVPWACWECILRCKKSYFSFITTMIIAAKEDKPRVSKQPWDWIPDKHLSE